MLAEVLVPEGAWGRRNRRSIFTYRVPPALEAQAQLGHLVAVPFGARLTQGIIWRVAGRDAAATAVGEASAQPEAEGQPVALRDISKLLDPAPILLPHQQALAEWLADYYCSSLPSAVLLMLPPRLGDGMRLVPGQNAPQSAEDASGVAGAHPLAGETSRALADFVREKGAVDEARVREMLGAARAGTAIAELLEHRVVDLVPAHLRTQRARVARLATSPDQAARWLEETRQQLDMLSPQRALSVRKQVAV
ncbi:MAG TPA: hypothetical protein VFU69_15605, partial [Ktedonobacterales bacterium]|nr:hypothetical protein [Ktedonobacterales bacterium]